MGIGEKVQLFKDRAKTIPISYETKAEYVTLSDGNNLEEVLNNDLTTPTVTHEETSFKVGVGDVNVSSSVVDGEVGRMVIKGKTYQNILPEPSLRNSMTNGKSMQKLNEGYENVNVVDGVAKSAILKGMTLVNCYKITESTPYTYKKGSSPLSKLTVNLSANKTYLILLDFSTIDKDGKEKINFYPISTFTDETTKQESNFAINGNGRFVYKYTPSKDVKDYRLVIGQNNFENNNPTVVLESAMIIEYQQGMENWDIPYFEGMQSVRMPVLTTIGNNLFDIDSVKKYVNATTIEKVGNGLKIQANESQSYRFVYSRSFKVEKGEYYNITYKVENENPENIANITLKDLTGKEVKGLYDCSITGSGTISKTFLAGDTAYVRPQLYASMKNDNGDYYVTYTDIMISKVTSSSVINVGYEPYKSNILSTPSDLVLGKVGDVEDTLNWLTGEVVESTYEHTFNGTESNITLHSNKTNKMTFRLPLNVDVKPNAINGVICNKMKTITIESLLTDDNTIGICTHNVEVTKNVYIAILKSELTTQDINGAKEWLSINTPTVRVVTNEKVIKTVDLSSSGNWEKVVLDGSENWATGNDNLSSVYRNYVFLPNNMHGVNLPCFVNDSNFPNIVYGENKQGVAYGAGNRAFYVFSDKKKYPTLESFKKYLSQNPMTVWYQIETHQDSTQVKQPIFFKDGHIQLSSGADNSLIPTLDYQAKTSNSYVMDLMKANTRYTMKAKSASGNFTLGGSSYSLGTNRVFSTTGAEFNANNMMVITGSYEDLMILEGELTSKTIPYFKGIKSAFEGEDKIEVLSTGKNLFDNNNLLEGSTPTTINIGDQPNWNRRPTHSNGRCIINFPVKPNTTYYLAAEGNLDRATTVYGFNKNNVCVARGAELGFTSSGRYKTITTTSNTYFISWYLGQDASNLVYNVRISTSKENVETYEPYKSNVSKIPLLSPLRSLPNGVCDELIIDRMKKKATLIQRVGYGVLGRQEHEYHYANSSIDTNLYQPWHTKDLGDNVANSTNANTMLCDKLLVTYENYVGRAKESIGMYPDKSANFNGCLLKTTLGAKTVKQWFEANEVSVYYQLATPVVTEIDLENFPFIYKDGHIFLNSEIAPVVEIAYNVNQTQQIQANNETLQRHELDILDLDKMIVHYIDADYRLKLLKFDMLCSGIQEEQYDL